MLQDLGHQQLQARLIAAASPGDSAVLRVQAIEVLRGGQLLQRLAGLDTRTPFAPDGKPLEVPDLNFDGHPDMRLVESAPAGAGTPYLNWLWDATAQRFVASPALDELGTLRLDAARKLLLSVWRDGPTRYGTDTYAWRGGALQAISREERLYSAPGIYTLKTYTWADGGWRLKASRPGRDG